ncbi:MAG TPA: hypothetical protein V6D03_02130, partial [Candidatus Caenarcaniphilales bacterium]
LHEDKIRFQLSYLDSLECTDVVLYSDFQLVDDNENRSTLWILGCLTRGQLIEMMLAPWGIQSACLLLKKSIFSQVLFAENLVFIEDGKLQLDLLIKGIPFIYTPLVGVFYRKHQANITGKKWTSAQIEGGIQFFEVVHQQYRHLKPQCQPGLEVLLVMAIEEKEKGLFKRVLNLLDMPVCLYKFKCSNRFLIKVLYHVRLCVPFWSTIFALYRKNKPHVILKKL